MDTGAPGKCCQIMEGIEPCPIPQVHEGCAHVGVVGALYHRGGFSATGCAQTRFELGVVGVPHPP